VERTALRMPRRLLAGLLGTSATGHRRAGVQPTYRQPQHRKAVRAVRERIRICMGTSTSRRGLVIHNAAKSVTCETRVREQGAYAFRHCNTAWDTRLLGALKEYGSTRTCKQSLTDWDEVVRCRAHLHAQSP